MVWTATWTMHENWQYVCCLHQGCECFENVLVLPHMENSMSKYNKLTGESLGHSVTHRSAAVQGLVHSSILSTCPPISTLFEISLLAPLPTCSPPPHPTQKRLGLPKFLAEIVGMAWRRCLRADC